MKKLLKYFLLFYLVTCTFCSFAQQGKIDSLFSLLKNDKEDTVRVIHLNLLSWEFKSLASYDTALYYANSALLIAQKVDFKQGISSAYAAMGNVYELKGYYPKALEEYLKALKIDEEIGNKPGIAKRLGNIGLVYADQGDNDRALDYYLKGLEMATEAGDKNGMAKHLGNIGVVYYEKGNLDKALEYYFKALQIGEEIGYQKGISTNLGNIGLVYSDEALAETESGKRDSLFDKALDYYFRTLKLREEAGYKMEMANTLANIGSLYTLRKQYKDAFVYLYRALAISDSIGAVDDVRSWYQELSLLYEKSTVPLPDSVGGKYLSMERMQLRALYYYKRFIAIRDMLFSEENKEQLVRKEMNYEFDKREAARKAELEKQAVVAAAEKQRQRIFLILVSCVLLLVVVFAGFIFRALSIARRQKQLILEQKQMVEEKQKEILDSIHYAKRIQTALLPTERYIERSLSRLMKIS